MDKRVGFGPRFGALLIDTVILCVAVVIVGPILGGLLGAAAMAEAAKASGDSASQGAAAGGLLGAITGLVFGLPIIGSIYYLLEGVTGYTPGKLALGLRIGTAEMTQAPVQQLLLRFACKHIHFILGALAIFTFSTLATLGTLAGVVMTLGCFLALGEKKQALHDMLAKTAVYPKTALQPRPSAVA